jgi:hypothetical protein
VWPTTKTALTWVVALMVKRIAFWKLRLITNFVTLPETTKVRESKPIRLGIDLARLSREGRNAFGGYPLPQPLLLGGVGALRLQALP